ncbi:DUF6701 domain-containing protein [Photobacterium damselae]|uniref:DUF6701 domain-containing protein n=1 Tax=Photobacterium damselae TaxID=38293 RepID=UPI0040677C47
MRINTLFFICFIFIFSGVIYAETGTPNFYFDQVSIGDNSCLVSDNGCTINIEKPIRDINGTVTGYSPVDFNTRPLIFVMPTIDYGTNKYIGRDAPATLRITDIHQNNRGGYEFKVRQDIAKYNDEFLNLDANNSLYYWYYWDRYQQVIKDNILDEDNIGNKKSKYLEREHIEYENELWEEIPFSLYVKPMPLITYFAIEPGTIKLAGKGKITAGEVILDKYIDSKVKLYKGNTLNKNVLNKLEREKYVKTVSNYGFSSNMGVIVNEQPNNNNSWITPYAINYADNTYIGLDGSEVNSSNYVEEPITVAYLQVEGRGVFKGLNFILGRDETKNTLQKDLVFPDTITKPVEEECNAYMDISNTDFDFSDVVKKPLMFLASKNSRKGSNGGWLRLCNKKNRDQSLQVSFVNDEDLNERNVRSIERKHHEESVGFMAFQRQVSETTCSMFPGPVQTWKGNNGVLGIDPKIIIKGVPLINGERRVGFNNVIYNSNPTYKACDGYICKDDGQFANKIDLGDFPVNDDGNLENQGDVNKLHNKKVYFFNVIDLRNKKITFPKGSVVHAKNLSMISSSIRSETNNPDDLIIYIHNKPVFNNIYHSYSDINNGSVITGLIYSERDVDISNGDLSKCDNYETCPEVSRINGAITAKSIHAHGNYQMIGVEINGKSSCFESEPNYSLTITPKIKTNTLCDDQPITFNVQASDGSSSNYTGQIHVTISSRFGGQWANNASFSDAKTFDNTASFQLNVKNNQAKFWLRANDAEKITVSGSIDKMEGAAPIGEYSFIPGGFKITQQSANIIAGKPFSATITAVACPADNLPKVITNYNGFKPLKFSTQYNQPATPAYEENKDGSLDRNRPIKVEIMNHQGATDLANIQFTNGKSEELTLRYREAGALKWQVTDPTCTPDSCPFIENNQSKQAKKLRQALSQGIVGSMSINARPWTFAICPLTFNGKNQYRLANGNISSGEGYASAGKPFDVLLKPLVWQSSKSSRTDIINVSNQNYCGYSVTNNFLATGAPSINGKLSIHYQLDTPKDGNKGNFKSGQMAVRSDLKGLLITGNTWDEVGSIWYQVGLDDYLGMNIDKSQRHIGRFYPAYFALTNPQVTYANTNENSSFTYLQQPFKVGFKLGAYNRSGDKEGYLVHNYLSFADDLKATFKVNSGNYVESGYTPLDSRLKRCGNISDPECLSRIDIAQKLSWPNFTKSALSQIDWPLAPYVVMRDQVRNHPITTEPDGPFFDWQLRIEQTTKPDGVTWQLGVKSNSQGVLVGSNDLRYGRMVLQDAAGDIRGPVAIPLRVEYWNGAAFETNADDSGSHFDGRNYCRQILYPQPDKGNSPSTSGLGNVDQGVASNEKLVAYPDVPVLEPFKQQVRFWQRLSNSTEPKGNGISCRGTYTYQPWLSYNWRKKGDEDPSAIVTFGVYQGNKRIIYRAEAGVASSNYQ